MWTPYTQRVICHCSDACGARARIRTKSTVKLSQFTWSLAESRPGEISDYRCINLNLMTPKHRSNISEHCFGAGPPTRAAPDRLLPLLLPI
ncbi:hypothetical protein EVAR_91429_1 [Eumeta japonica]|uniref:Uncharacterized protein n=1 Tax=Eumeta variegata TaxID=151549 RepID=A0A4C1X3A8_EUMVA|nr:hypothetical protein EVAR_91429_1 [Eumeta japonica]